MSVFGGARRHGGLMASYIGAWFHVLVVLGISLFFTFQVASPSRRPRSTSFPSTDSILPRHRHGDDAARSRGAIVTRAAF
eukprot:3899005-Rhodomonas_salina.1